MFPLPHARLALSLGAFTLVVCSHIASAQIALDSQLAKPVSPAVEVLLVRHGNDRRVQERWRGAVSHASPDVRATVARAIQMAGAVSLADVLDARLGEETDLRAASEQAASVTAIGGRISDNARQACTRLGAPVAAAVAEALARVAPAVLLSELPTLRGHGPDVDIALAHILRAWLRFAPGQAARLQLALVRAGDEAAWSVVLRAHDDAGLTLGGGPLTTNLSSKHVDVPALGLTHLLHLEEADFTTTVAAPGVRPAIDALGANQTSPRGATGSRTGGTSPRYATAGQLAGGRVRRRGTQPTPASRAVGHHRAVEG